MNFIKGLKYAFAVEKTDEYKYSEADLVLLSKVVSKIKKFGLEMPATLFLETVKPLNYVGSQTMVFFKPIVSLIFTTDDYDNFSRLLEHRSCISKLLDMIEGKEIKQNES